MRTLGDVVAFGVESAGIRMILAALNTAGSILALLSLKRLVSISSTPCTSRVEFPSLGRPRRRIR
jgi:hypothetical protein